MVGWGASRLYGAWSGVKRSDTDRAKSHRSPPLAPSNKVRPNDKRLDRKMRHSFARSGGSPKERVPCRCLPLTVQPVRVVIQMLVFALVLLARMARF